MVSCPGDEMTPGPLSGESRGGLRRGPDTAAGPGRLWLQVDVIKAAGVCPMGRTNSLAYFSPYLFCPDSLPLKILKLLRRHLGLETQTIGRWFSTKRGTLVINNPLASCQ